MWMGTLKKMLVGQPSVNTPTKRGRKPQTIGGLIGALIIIFRGILDAAAFSIRIFLRKNLGERTFSIWNILFAFLWAWYFVSEGIQFETLRPDYRFLGPLAEAIFNFIMPEASERAVDKILFFRGMDQVFWYLYALIHYIYQALQYLDTFLLSLFNWTYYPKVSLFAYYYSMIVVFLGISNMIVNWKKSNITHEKPDSYYRGDSIFFNWLDLVKIRIQGSDIVLNKAFIWLFVEPVAILVLSSFLYYSGLDPNFALFLFFGAIALFLEELQELRINRAELLDVFDGEYKAQRIEESLVKHDQVQSKHRPKPVGAVLSKRRR